MPNQPRVIAFDVDEESLACLRQAFPSWEVEAVVGASSATLEKAWSPGPASLLVVGAGVGMAETLALCRGLRSQAGRARTPLLVLVPSANDDLVRAALEAGAHSCLVLPVHHRALVEALARADEGNKPGRHTRGLDRAQEGDRWQDDGGEG